MKRWFCCCQKMPINLQNVFAKVSGRRGIIISDSIGRAWRNGTIGTAIGISGLPGIIDLNGILDMHARSMQATTIGLADEIAAAASIIMGQAAESRP